MDRTEAAEQLHQHFIRTTPEELWDALTTPEATRLFYHGLAVESDFRPGSGIRYLSEQEGERVPVIRGDILEVEEGRRLVHTFAFTDSDDAPTRVEYDIEQLGGGVTRLRVVHDGFQGETDTFTTTRTGWPLIFSGLKTLLETGEPLAIPSSAGEDAAH